AAGAATIAECSVLHQAEPLVLRPGAATGVSAADLVAAASALHRLPTVSIVVGDPAAVPPALAAAADVCLSTVPDPPPPWVEAPLDAVEAAVAAEPLAALTLVTLLRTTDHLPMWDALASEAASYGLLLGSDSHRRWLDRRGLAAPKPTDHSPVVVRRDGPVLSVELDRPEARNAIDAGLRDALVDAFAVASADPTIEAVHLGGRGPSFSAGGDLDEFGAVPDPATSLAVRLTRHPGLGVHAVAGRTSAFVHGPCVGAGVEVPAFAHHVVADPATTFRLPELGMGLVPGAGGTASLPRRLGRHRTAWLAVTGAEIDAPTALAWGLVDELLPRDHWPSASRA
ncbi:MAG TPA: enoyl-CoA hydratase/isomerase family protein, partial [Acidimicrobiales bacterium]